MDFLFVRFQFNPLTRGYILDYSSRTRFACSVHLILSGWLEVDNNDRDLKKHGNGMPKLRCEQRISAGDIFTGKSTKFNYRVYTRTSTAPECVIYAIKATKYTNLLKN